MLSFVATLLFAGATAQIIPGKFPAAGQSKIRIVNGIPALASEYPFIADLRFTVDAYNYTSDSFCTGSLIRLEYPATILTAAHCLEGMQNYTLGAYLLRSDQDAPRTADNNFSFYAVSEFVIHPDYGVVESTDSDIGVMFIDADLSANPRLEVVTLPSYDAEGECCFEGEELEVIGYGADYEGGNATDTLEYTTQLFVPRNECNALFLSSCEFLGATGVFPDCNFANGTTTSSPIPSPNTTITSSNFTNFNFTYSFNNTYIIINETFFNFSVNLNTTTITDTMICAYEDDTDSCQGDSGGPLIKAGTLEQVGVTSWGIGCNAGLPGVYVNLVRFTEWIEDTIANKCASDANCFESTESGDYPNDSEDTEESEEDPEGDGVAGFEMWTVVSVAVASVLASAA